MTESIHAAAPLTAEELAELAELEQDAAASKAAAAAARKRMHLAALRLRKRLTEGKHGEHGTDFVVVETTGGLFAVRRPVDLEVDAFTAEDDTGSKDPRVQTQEFLCSIALYPEPHALKLALAAFPAVPAILTSKALELCGKLVEAEGK